MKHLTTLIITIHCLTLGATDVRFPMRGVVTTEPKEVTVAEVVDTIRADEWYIIESETELICLASPVGIVEIKRLNAPMTVMSRFAGGDGTMQVREFQGPYLYAVTAAVAGKAELIVVPVGVSAADQVQRVMLTVQGPRPPPIPPGPDPAPEPDQPPAPVKSFRVIFIKESGDTLSAQQSAIPGAKSIRDYLNERTTKDGDQPGWREFDPQSTTTNEPAVIQELWKSIKAKTWTTPCVAIEVNTKVTVVPFPSNAAECLAMLKKAGGE